MPAHPSSIGFGSGSLGSASTRNSCVYLQLMCSFISRARRFVMPLCSDVYTIFTPCLIHNHHIRRVITADVAIQRRVTACCQNLAGVVSQTPLHDAPCETTHDPGAQEGHATYNSSVCCKRSSPHVRSFFRCQECEVAQLPDGVRWLLSGIGSILCATCGESVRGAFHFRHAAGHFALPLSA